MIVMRQPWIGFREKINEQHVTFRLIHSLYK